MPAAAANRSSSSSNASSILVAAAAVVLLHDNNAFRQQHCRRMCPQSSCCCSSCRNSMRHLSSLSHPFFFSFLPTKSAFLLPSSSFSFSSSFCRRCGPTAASSPVRFSSLRATAAATATAAAAKAAKAAAGQVTAAAQSQGSGTAAAGAERRKRKTTVAAARASKPAVTQGIQAAAAAGKKAARASAATAAAAGVPLAAAAAARTREGLFFFSGGKSGCRSSVISPLRFGFAAVPRAQQQQQQQLQQQTKKKKKKLSPLFPLLSSTKLLQPVHSFFSSRHCRKGSSSNYYSNMTGGADNAAAAAAAAVVTAAVNGGDDQMAMALTEEELRREKAIFNALDAMGIDYKVYRHRRLMTVDAMLKEPLLQGAGLVAGNLFLKDKKRGYFLVTVLHDSPTPMKGLGKLLQAANLRFAAPEALGALLDVEEGAVTPLAVISDTRKEVQVVMDERLRENSSSRILVHPLHNKATLAIAAADLIQFVEAHGHHTIQWIDCEEAAKLAAAGGEGSPRRAKDAAAAAAGGEQRQPNAEKKQLSLMGGAAAASAAAAAAGGGGEGCMLGVTVKKSENFSEWYTQVILRSEMIEYYDISGCYIMRPWSYFIWEQVQQFFDSAIKQRGVQNSYFPMFVSKQKLEKEKDHVEGFSPEVAWVTHYGESPLAEKIAIRPTSETIMYPAFAKWIRSHRDLPLKLNQWCSVVRWEFKQPTPFLRTREFLWQEGHTAHATEEEAMEMVLDILELYRRWYEECLAVPVIKGEKSENEKFAGGVKTTTCESFIAESGRGIQAATSHLLGTNFAKMFEIQFEDEDGKKRLAHQTSWGCTTRSLGVMVMVHGDDKGLVLPPRVAPVQVIIIPILFKDAVTKEILAQCDAIHATLTKAGIRSKIDDRANYTPGWKFNNWEMKGVPLRVEVGPRDVAKGSTRVVRRDSGAAAEVACGAALVEEVQQLLQTIQQQLLITARQRLQHGIEQITSFEEVMPALNRRHLILAPWCEDPASEDAIKRETQRLSEELHQAAAAATGGKDLVGEKQQQDQEEQQQQQQPEQVALTGSMKCLCIPFDQPPMPEGTKCFFTGKPAKRWSLWGRSY